MKTLSSFCLFFLALAYCAKAHNEVPLPLSLSFDSFTVDSTSINNTITFTLKLMPNEALQLNHELDLVSDSKNQLTVPYFSIDFLELKQSINPVGGPMLLRPAIRLSYTSIPYFYQKLTFQLKEIGTGRVVKSLPMYLYFTPYNTIEVWNEEDFEKTKRIWDDPQPNSTLQRKYIRKQDIPVSNMTEADFNNPAIERSYQSVEGLAYTIPVYKVIESDTIEDFEYSRMAGAAASSNFRFFTGTIRGNIRALVESDLACSGTSPAKVEVPIYDIHVTAMDQDYVALGCFGVDDRIGDTYTDANGNFAINIASYQRYKGGVFSCAREGDYLEIYLIIEARNGSNSIRIVKRLGGTRDITISKSNAQPIHHAWGNLNFGTIRPSTSTLKPQLLSWAGHCRNLANTVYGLPGSNDPLEIRIYPMDQSKGSMFIPGGVKEQILAAGIVFPLIGPVAPAVLSQYLSNKDCLYMGEGDELDEDVIYHEFGHYFMWHLQNQSWLNPLDASFFNHGLTYNSNNPSLAWTEGWAEGFGEIADIHLRFLDNEGGTHSACDFGNPSIIDYEARTIYGSRPEEVLLSPVVRGAILVQEDVLTHGYVSEMNIASMLYDLFDGNGNVADRDGDGIGFTLSQICQPLLNNRGSGGYVNQERLLITNVHHYYEELIEINNCTKKREIADLFMFNRISDFNTPSQHRLNTDEIAMPTMIHMDQFKVVDKTAYKAVGIFSQVFNIDNPSLDNANETYNVGTGIFMGSRTLSDNLTVSNGATLAFNQNYRRGYLVSSTLGNPPAGSLLFVEICGRMRLTVQQNGIVDMGNTTTAQRAMVNILDNGLFHFQSGSVLNISDGSILKVSKGATLWIRSGASINVMGKGKIVVDPGGFICVETGAALNFSPQALFEINNGAINGINSVLGLGASSCSNLACLGVPVTSNGNTALDFDGVNDQVEVADQGRLNFSTGDFTFEAFIRTDRTTTTSHQILLSKRNNTDEEGFMFGLWNDGHLYAQLDGAPNIGFDRGPTLLDGLCHHVALTRQGSIVSFYVDGNFTHTLSLSNRDISSQGSLRIGRDARSGLPFDGLIGEVRIWNYARSLNDLRASSATALTPQAGLFAYWDMNGSSQLLPDLSASGNTGILGTTAACITEAADPVWVAAAAVTCNIAGNFRTDGEKELIEKNNNTISIYPNPFDDQLNILINGESENYQVKVMDVHGQVVYQKELVKPNEVLSIGEDFTSGIYLIQIYDQSETKTFKVIKSK